MFDIDEQDPILPSYRAVASVLATAELVMGPAHVHGLLSGFCCVNDNGTTASILDILANELEPGDNNDAVLECYQDLLRLTQLQLNQDNYAFQCLLPDDDAALSERAEALGEWSAGFLIGANHAGLSPSNTELNDVAEALAQFTEIALIEYESIGESEAEERDFYELVEYTRVAAILIHETLVASQATQIH